MNPERFQSATGQSIDDNCCLFFGNTSPLFYTVNPRSGISLRQQEQLGAPSILKSFRDLPGCTRLSSSLSNLDSKRTQFPLLPDINQRGTMGKSLPGHHSSKRFVRERYNPPFKVNAKIKHVYTQEVTTIEDQGQNQHHHHHSHHQQPIYTATCHRQTQTEPDFFPENKKKPEVDSELEEEVEEQILKEQLTNLTTSPDESLANRADASTSPIPPEFPFPDSKEIGNPFAGCSQMTVYPPLNYVRKLEDLEKITGHIVIQRFFTKTDDAFGTWLEKQLGMTSKSVSVDTSEFENAKTAELQDDDEGIDAGTKNRPNDFTDAIVIEPLADVEEEVVEEGMIEGNIKNPGEGENQETENNNGTETPFNAECAFVDPIKCECYLEEIERADEYNRLKEIEEQIIPLVSTDTSEIIQGGNREDEIETLISSKSNEPVFGDNEVIPMKKKVEEENIDEVVRCTLEAYLMASSTGEGETEEICKDDNNLSTERSGGSPSSQVKSDIDSGRADSIQSQEKGGVEGSDEVEGNTSHDSVETVYEMSIPASSKDSLIQGLDDDKPGDTEGENGLAILQRSLSADSCIGTESSGDTKNQTNESQSSNDIESLENILNAPPSKTGNEIKGFVDMTLGSAATAVSTLLKKSASAKTVTLGLAKRKESAKNPKSAIFEEHGRTASIASSQASGRDAKTDAEDADASESESEITSQSDRPFMTKSKNVMKHHDDDAKLGTDLELEEVDEYEGDDDERDAFDAMVANHLKYSRGLPTAAGAGRRSRFNRGTQTTKSVEPSTSGSLSPCSSSNSSFDVEIISKSKRITTASTMGGNVKQHQDINTPSNMTMAWHEGGRRRSYLPSGSSSLNLLNMKFSLGKDFESEVSIRVPTKSSTTPSSSIPLPSGSGVGGGKSLLSSSRSQHHYYQNRGVSSSSHQSQNVYHQNQLHSPTSTAVQQIAEPTELQSLWKDVRTKLDVQVDEIAATIPEEEPAGELHVKGNGILPTDNTGPSPHASGSAVKLRRNEDKIKRSLQRLKKILED